MSRGANVSLTMPGLHYDVGSMRRSLVYIGYVVFSIASIVYARHFEKTFLSIDLTDGFTSQVQYIWNYWSGRNSILDLEPLLWIHVLRALIASVFVSVEEIGGSALVAFAMVVLTLPILRVFAGLERGYLVFALPLVAMVVSFRTYLVILSVAYLLLFIRGSRGSVFLSLSFIFANLSSGAVLNNLLVAATVARNHRPYSVVLYVYVFLLAISFGISALDKYQGFSEQRSGYDSTVYGASGIEAILSRSTLFVSAMEGDYTRLLAYAGLGVVAFLLLFFALKTWHYRGYAAILLSVVPSLIFEGLGFMSLLVPIMLFLAGERLPWRPAAGREHADA